MATIANCRIADSDYVSVSRFSVLMSARFPVPSSVRAFCIIVSDERDPIIRRVSRYVPNLLLPESSYMEPQVGQIWPR